MVSLLGESNSTSMPPNQICKQSWVTNLSLYKHWPTLRVEFHQGSLNRKEVAGHNKLASLQGATTLSIMPFSITTLSIIALRITTLSIIAFSIIIINATQHNNDTQHNGRAFLYWVSFMLIVIYGESHIKSLFAVCHYAECRYAECRGAAYIITTKLFTTVSW